MAASKAHVDVAERRLRPVYDALDNLNNKQAIKLTDNILKKQKDFHCAKALKALALIRSGRASESHAILDNIKQTAVKLDDSTLQAMTMCYKETKNSHGVVDIYELAVKQTSNNEEFLSHLFMACVRVQEYAKQQKAAMNLYKAFPKNPYYFWAVMSCVMQAVSSKEVKKKNMFLSLAERMVEKLLKEEKVDAEEEVRLYVMILEQQQKYEQLLELVQTDFGEKLRCILSEKDDKIVEYLMLLERWPEANLKYKSLIEKHIDQWSFYKGYLSSFIRLRAAGYSPDTPVDTENIQPDDTTEQVKYFLLKLGENSVSRAPTLAVMELIKIDDTIKDKSEELGGYLIKYFEAFGSKPCCYSDVQSYFDLLKHDKAKEVIEKLHSNLGTCEEDATCKEKVRYLVQGICLECLSRQLGFQNSLTNDAKFEKAKAYMKRYKESLKLGSDLNATEPQYGDQLVLLAVYLLLDVNCVKGDESMVWHILLFLEEAVESSPTFAQFKLLLFYLYSKLGAFGACEALISDVEVKYIMYDSLGYLLTAGSYISGQFQSTDRLYDSSIGFFISSQKDTPEQIIASYKYGSFGQVLEMTELKRRLSKSYQFAQLKLEKLYIDLLKYANTVGETKDKFLEIQSALKKIKITDLTTENLCDNRDLSFMDNFEPMSQRLTDAEKKVSFKDNVSWIRLRYLLLKVISNCLPMENEVEEVVVNGDAEVNGDTMEMYLQLIDEYPSVEPSSVALLDRWSSIHRPPPSPVDMYTSLKYHRVLASLVKCCETLKHSTELDDTCVQFVTDDIKLASDVLTANFDVIVSQLTRSHGDNQMFNGKNLASIVYFVETCHLSIVLVLAMKLALENKLITLRKGKRKKRTSKHVEITSALKHISKTLKEKLKSLLEKLTAVKVEVIEKTLDIEAIEELFEQTNSTTVTKVWQKIQASYKQSIEEINQIIGLKLKYIDALV